MAERACRRVDARIFDAQSRQDTAAALRYCTSCPVLAQCYRWAQRQRGQLDCVAGGQLWGAARKWLRQS
ncbi:MAG: WhiB family transcriptional regulator [Mycobacterium sp.]